MSEEIHVGDTTPFILTIREKGVAIDIANASVKDIYFDDPDHNNNRMVRAAVFNSDGTDGKLKYVTVKEDLKTSGRWRIQAYIVTPQGSWHTEVKIFKVERNL